MGKHVTWQEARSLAMAAAGKLNPDTNVTHEHWLAVARRDLHAAVGMAHETHDAARTRARDEFDAAMADAWRAYHATVTELAGDSADQG